MVPRLTNTYLFGQYLPCKYCKQDRLGAWFNTSLWITEYTTGEVYLSFDCSSCNQSTLEEWLLGTS